MLACPFCGEANPDDAAACLNCQRNLRGRTKRPEGWEQEEARSRHRASWLAFLSPAVSLATILVLRLWSDTIGGTTLAAGAIGFYMWAVAAISASRQLHREHGVTPLPSGGTYLLPVIAMLIGAAEVLSACHGMLPHRLMLVSP